MSTLTPLEHLIRSQLPSSRYRDEDTIARRIAAAIEQVIGLGPQQRIAELEEALADEQDRLRIAHHLIDTWRVRLARRPHSQRGDAPALAAVDRPATDVGALGQPGRAAPRHALRPTPHPR